MNYSVIGQGFLAQRLKEQLHNVTLFGRETLTNIPTYQDIVIVAAPTGNRLQVNNDHQKDSRDCVAILEQVKKIRYQNLIYLSTVDVYASRTSLDDALDDVVPESYYGRNRFLLEKELKSLPSCHVIRLPSLCHPTIKKNILYDLSHKRWLESISISSNIQWYPVARLGEDINRIIELGISQINLVSRPISNHSLIQYFCPELIDIVIENKVTDIQYDIKTVHRDSGYWIDDKEIWQRFADFFDNHRQQKLTRI